MAQLCAYLNYSLHRTDFSMSSSYFSVHCIQVNMHCKELWQALLSCNWPDIIFVQGTYTISIMPLHENRSRLCKHFQCRFVKIVSSNFLFSPFAKFVALKKMPYGSSQPLAIFRPISIYVPLEHMMPMNRSLVLLISFLQCL